MVQDKLDHWFRHEYGRTLSLFLTRYGSHHLESIEDAIHDTLYKAMMVWGYKGIPENPSAWIYRVSHNNLLDHFRKKKAEGEFPELPVELKEEQNNEINDEVLKLIFACCHPKLKEYDSIILCLKFAAGFGLHEIARTILLSYEATKKKFQRAKVSFQVNNLNLEIPPKKHLRDRIDKVLKVIFLMFTEGYRPTEGDQILKEDLCYEALRIAMNLFEFENFRTSRLYALISLMCFKCARIDARKKGGNIFIRLEDQDRKLWSQELLSIGHNFLKLSFQEENHCEYHFHAAIESQYVIAKSFKETNWYNLLNIYNYWRKIMTNPSIELNRIVVIIYTHGAEKALAELEENCNERKDHLYHAIKGEALQLLGKSKEAPVCFEQAKKLSKNRAEKIHFESKTLLCEIDYY